MHITKTGGTSIENVAFRNNINWGKNDPLFERKWHHPIFKFKRNEYLKYDWFIVVRNPYTRIISEFHCKWGGVGKMEDKNNLTARDFNEIIRRNIKNRLRFKYQGHYLEQYKYFLPNVNILKFEKLENDFNLLMKKYNLNIKLDEKSNTSSKIFGITDFDKETIDLINEVYDKDFKFFNYNKIYIK